MVNMAQKSIVRCLHLLVLLFLISGAGGCAALYGLRESPKISVADIQVQQAGLLENAFLLQLRVMNPNDVAIDLKAITCNLTLDGRPFARGVTDSNQRIEAYSSTMVPVSVYSSAVDMAGALARLLQAGVRMDDPAKYALEGTVILDVHGFEVKKDFTSKGELSWQRLRESFTGD
ncbi:MAG: LEA type 2 family protein [bacterium]|nr:LEA type 2 family protein [bacterium]